MVWTPELTHCAAVAVAGVSEHASTHCIHSTSALCNVLQKLLHHGPQPKELLPWVGETASAGRCMSEHAAEALSGSI